MFVAASSPWILQIYGGPKYVSYWPLLSILAITQGFYALYFVFSSAVYIRLLPWTIMLSDGITGGVNFIFAPFLISALGTNGVAWGQLLGFSAGILVTQILLSRIKGYRFDWNGLGKIALPLVASCSLIVVGQLVYFSIWIVPIYILAGAGVFGFWMGHKDGKFLAMRVKTTANMGAYLSTFASAIPTILYATLLAGEYTTPVIHVEVTAVFTNTAPVDAYRGAGRPEATYVVERLVETAAREMKLDPAEIRRRNFIKNFPYQTPVALLYDIGDYEATMAAAIKLADVAGFPQRRKEAEARGKLRGLGYAAYIEACGIAPSAVAGSLGARAGPQNGNDLIGANDTHSNTVDSNLVGASDTHREDQSAFPIGAIDTHNGAPDIHKPGACDIHDGAVNTHKNGASDTPDWRDWHSLNTLALGLNHKKNTPTTTDADGENDSGIPASTTGKVVVGMEWNLSDLLIRNRVSVKNQ